MQWLMLFGRYWGCCGTSCWGRGFAIFRPLFTIFFRHIKMFRVSAKLLRAIVNWRTKTPLAVSSLLIIARTSSNCPYQVKKGPPSCRWKYPLTPHGRLLLSSWCMYLVCKRIDFTIKMLPAYCSSVSSKLFHKTFHHLASIFGPIFRLFSTSNQVTMLTQINFLVFTSVVSWVIVFVFTASSVSGTVRSSFPLIYSSYNPWSCM